MSIEPRYLSADMDNAPIHLVDDEYRLQESLRVMSSDPHEPRIFSQERIFVPVFLSLGSGMTWAMVSMLLSDSEGGQGQHRRMALPHTLPRNSLSVVVPWPVAPIWRRPPTNTLLMN